MTEQFTKTLTPDLRPLSPWVAGEQVSARKLNEAVHTINALVGGVRPPMQVRPRPAVSVMAHVVVRAVNPEDELNVDVQRVSPRIGEDGYWDGGFVADGDVTSVPVHPYAKAQDYEAFVWPESIPLDETTPILIAMRIGGVWWLPQYVRYRMPAIDQNVALSDCRPFLEGGL